MVITGKEAVVLNLTVDEVSFIVSGLRDVAAVARARIQLTRDQDLIDLDTAVERDNLFLADALECIMLHQIREVNRCATIL